MGRSAAVPKEPPTNQVVIRDSIREAAAPYVKLFKDRIPGHDFTDTEEEAILAVLAMTEDNITQTAELLGLVKSSVFNVRGRNIKDFEERRRQWKQAAAFASQEVFVEATQQVRAKIGEASARDAAVVAGIYAEKSGLFAGDNEIRVNHVHSADPALVAELTRRIDGYVSKSLTTPVDYDVLEGEWTVKD